MISLMDSLNKRLKAEAPKESVGIGGFKTYARVSESVKLSSSVPTTYLEDGSHAMDNITNGALSLDISGEVADIYIERQPALEAITRAQAEIGNIASKYAGAKTISAIQRSNALINDALDTVRKVDTMIADGKQALSFLGNQDKESRSNQEKFLDSMQAIHDDKRLIDIELKYQTHSRMKITDFTYEINNEEDKITFKITATQLRFSETIYTDISDYFKKPSPALNKQPDATKDKGPQEPKKSTSLLSSIFGG